MKLRYGIILVTLICCCPVISLAWEIAPIQYVTEEALVQELTDFAMAELASMCPTLTDEQLADFTVATVCELQGKKGWSVTLIYKNCNSIMMDFSISRNESGSLQVLETLNWPIEELIAQFDSCISSEDAIALGRLCLATAIKEQSLIYPEDASLIVQKYGFAILDPSKFIVEATFVSPLNLGSPESPAYWSLRFSLPLNPEAGYNRNENPYWYHVKIDATCGIMIEQSMLNLFSDIE